MDETLEKIIGEYEQLDFKVQSFLGEKEEKHKKKKAKIIGIVIGVVVLFFVGIIILTLI